jgi:hypothetical protein
MMESMPGMGATTSTHTSTTMPGGQTTMPGGQSTMPSGTTKMPSSTTKMPSGHGTMGKSSMGSKSSHKLPTVPPGMMTGG